MSAPPPRVRSMRRTAFDVERFVREREGLWHELEARLPSVERAGVATLDAEGARRLAKLYRMACSDLVRARTEQLDASLQDYLNDLVARAHRQIYRGESSRGRGRAIVRFFLLEFPALVRRERRVIALSAALFFAGLSTGALAAVADPAGALVLLPEQHQEWTPEERVARDEGDTDARSDTAAAFSSFLFTHNIQVSFLVFALGVTFGVGTVALLFYNGVPIGALLWQYHAAGEGLFFWAWILPHGIPEITEIVIAGGAGLVLARGLLFPGRRSRRTALVEEAKTAARLVVGGMPILVVAGLVEGTISQMHAPLMPYWAKLVFAALLGVALFAWLALAGRAPRAPRAAERAPLLGLGHADA